MRFLADDDVRPPVAAERLDSRGALAGAQHEAVPEVPRLALRIERLQRHPLRRLARFGRVRVEAELPGDGEDRLPAAEGDHVPGGACRLCERQQRLEMAAAAGEGEEDAHGMILRS